MARSRGDYQVFNIYIYLYYSESKHEVSGSEIRFTLLTTYSNNCISSHAQIILYRQRNGSQIGPDHADGLFFLDDRNLEIMNLRVYRDYMLPTCPPKKKKTNPPNVNESLSVNINKFSEEEKGKSPYLKMQAFSSEREFCYSLNRIC